MTQYVRHDKALQWDCIISVQRQKPVRDSGNICSSFQTLALYLVGYSAKSMLFCLSKTIIVCIQCNIYLNLSYILNQVLPSKLS